MNAQRSAWQYWVIGFMLLVSVTACGGTATPTPAPAGSTPTTAATAPTTSASTPTVAGSTASAGTTTTAQGTSSAGGQGEPYRIGAVLSITGGASTLGMPERNTLQMLQDMVNSQGGVKGPDGQMHRLDVVIYDDQSDESQAVLATTRLINQDKVAAVICCTTSGATMAAIDVATRSQVPLISLATAAGIAHPVEQRHWIFKVPWDDAMVIERILQYLQSQKLQRIGLLTVSTEYGDSARQAFESLRGKYGVTIAVSDRFNTGTTDVTTQLNRIRVSNVQAVVVWALPPETAVAVKNYHDLGMNIPLILSHGVATKAFIDAAGSAANGATLPAGKILVVNAIPASDPQYQALKQYSQLYTQRFGGPLTTFGGHAWDAFWIVEHALEKAGPDHAALRDAIEQTKNFAGITGIFTYSPTDHVGLAPDSLVMVTIQNGAFQLLSTQ